MKTHNLYNIELNEKSAEIIAEMFGPDNGKNDQSLMLALQDRFPKGIICFSLPPTFIAGKCGVDIQTKLGAITVIWKTDLGTIEDTIFSMCVIDGCSKDFKTKYKQLFKERYTQLDGIDNVFKAVEKTINFNAGIKLYAV